MSNESKIVNLAGQPVQEAEGETTQPQPPRRRLNAQIIEQLAAQLNRLSELSQHKIISRNDEAEKAGIHAFLAEHFVVFGSELLGCWYTVRGEYEPLLRVITAVTARVAGQLEQVREVAAAQIAATQSQTEPK